MTIQELYKSAGLEYIQHDPKAARLTINLNQVVDSHVLAGLYVEPEETDEGVIVKIDVDKGVSFEKPVHLCFGVTQETGLQKIDMKTTIHRNAKINILAHCIFPVATDVRHEMEADISIEEGAEYSYVERHIHGLEGGITVLPKASVTVGKDASFRTTFDLLQGRVGLIDIDYQATCHENSLMHMIARVNGKADDRIRIHESGMLQGAGAVGVLESKIAVRENASAVIENEMTAEAAHARGHVDCKEIVKDNGTARAVPIVQVNHPKAHITHEAAIGSVDHKQLETLMSRGLSEDQATDLIIQGMLS